ncbi:MAG: sugar transferase [Prevotella sp.]|nr:sugar transferase [Prevotella sp.]
MYKHFFKRVIDIIFALIALPFVLLIIIIVAPFVWSDDRGPIFYAGKRIGYKGKPFGMLKFRSMKVNAPDIRLEDGSTYNGDDDPRVTKVGRFLRKTSLDEIPQFLNVLAGQMSFIGPRPDPLDWLDKYKPEERIFLTVKPGITGYNQAYFRNSANSQEKIDHDVYYAKNISFWMDVKIIFRTIKTVLFLENLYHDETKREFGSAIPLEAVPDNYFQQLEQTFESHSYLTTGRGALMLVGQSIETDNKHIYIPAYSCESMVKPFKNCGWKVSLYPLNEDLTICQDFVDQMVANEEKDFTILTMNYFGVAGTKDKVEEIKSKRSDIFIIEDFTHCLFTLEAIYSDKVDYYVGSIRKSLGVPDGAIILSNHPLKEAEEVLESSFVTKRLKALKEKDDYTVEKKDAQKEGGPPDSWRGRARDRRENHHGKDE